MSTGRIMSILMFMEAIIGNTARFTIKGTDSRGIYISVTSGIEAATIPFAFILITATSMGRTTLRNLTMVFMSGSVFKHGMRR